MRLLSKLVPVLIATLMLTACGGGGIASTGSGGSGIGGTGITLVQGNVSSVNGQFYVYIDFDDAPILLNWIVSPALANTSDIVVTGGGRTSSVGSTGAFVLPGVTPNDNFVLTFTVSGSSNARVNIGQVKQGAVVTVKNVSIDTSTNTAQPSKVEIDETGAAKASHKEEEEEEVETEKENEVEEEHEELEEQELEEQEDEEDEEDEEKEDEGGGS